MTSLPTAPGSYVRHPDGSLELIQDTRPSEIAAAEAPALSLAEPAPVEPARKGALKAPLKE